MIKAGIETDVIFDESDQQWATFAKAVWSIEGVTAYEPRRLPEWVRVRAGDVDRDAELFSARFGHLDVWCWGCAVIDGEDVLILDAGETDWFFDHYGVAAGHEYGLTFVEPGRGTGWLMYYTEQRKYRPLKVADRS